MITERAKTAFDTLLQGALRSGLTHARGAPRIERVEAIEAPRPRHRLARHASQGQQIVVLTVSSYLFRLLAILHFRDDAATRAFFAGGGGEDGAEAPALTRQEFLDRVGECGNLVCGALNRDLGHHFPHVGMSTPNIVDRDCMRYVELLGCGLQRHYRIDLPGDAVLHASLCVSDYGTVDFHVEPRADAEGAADEVDAGELEFF